MKVKPQPWLARGVGAGPLASSFVILAVPDPGLREDPVPIVDASTPEACAASKSIAFPAVRSESDRGAVADLEYSMYILTRLDVR